MDFSMMLMVVRLVSAGVILSGVELRMGFDKK